MELISVGRPLVSVRLIVAEKGVRDRVEKYDDFVAVLVVSAFRPRNKVLHMLHLAAKLARLERIAEVSTVEVEQAEFVCKCVLHVRWPLLQLSRRHMTLKLFISCLTRLLSNMCW